MLMSPVLLTTHFESFRDDKGVLMSLSFKKCVRRYSSREADVI